MGHLTIFIRAEEKILCNWINSNVMKGLPLSKQMLLDTLLEKSADGHYNLLHENKHG